MGAVNYTPGYGPRVLRESALNPATIESGSRHAGVPEPFRLAGQQAAGRLPAAQKDHTSQRKLRRRAAAIRTHLQSVMLRDPKAGVHQLWLTENARLLTAAEREAREFTYSLHDFPAVATTNGTRPRVSVLTGAYLDEAQGSFDEDTFTAFLVGAQEAHDLELGELWATRPALVLGLLERIITAAEGDGEALPQLIGSIRRIGEANWKELFTSISMVDHVLASDPAGAYAAMDYESRDLYRHAVSDLAKNSTSSERQVAEAAVELAASAAAAPGIRDAGNEAAARRAHVGFYLLDRGVGVMRARVRYRTPLFRRLGEGIVAHPTAFYLGGVAFVTLAIVGSILNGIHMPISAALAFVLLLLPVTQAAVEFINALTPAIVRPRALPKLDFSRGIPTDCATLVAVPTLLLNEKHVHELAMDLEIRYLANRDPQVCFALLTDSIDSDRAADERDEALVPLAVSLIEGLNERYGTPQRSPFYLFHRHRIYNPSERRWMGWERKRGKILDLNRLLRGGFDAFPVKVGDLDALSRIRYVITLDSDTQLPRDSAQRLVGTLAHPLNRAVVDPVTKKVIEGYGILQPRIGVSTQSASRSWLASLLSGQTGFDIYTRAVSDAYQDLFGEGSFTGKGIYEVDAFRATLEKRFPENTLLSHDLIEGIFARAALASDIELIDDYPTHFSAYSRRKHRWMRGDWQILRWLTARVPDYKGRLIPNPISVISRWKIIDNLRRSLFEPATLLLLLAGWFVLPGSAAFWTTLSIATLLLPAYASLLVSLTRAPWGRTGFRLWAQDTFRTFAKQHLLVVLNLTYLLHDALLAMDAIVRTLARVFVSRQRLLEWETAAEAKEAVGPKRAADVYLDWSPLIAATLALALSLGRHTVLPVALPVIMLWVFAGPLAYWLSRPPRSGAINLGADDERWLRAHALRMWRYFREFSTERSNWLVPDHVREDGVRAERLSPTNLGFLLNARIAAVHFGYLTLAEFARDTKLTLAGAARLPLIRGHFPNWCSTEDCQGLHPMFVSTVDSGNLAACLWTLKQSALGFLREAPDAETLWTGITDLARLIGETGDPSARALSERVLRVDGEWKAALPQLDELARHVAADATGETAWWAQELVERIDRARAWIDTGVTADLRADLEEIAAQAERLVADMDFAFLYDLRKKTLSVGYNADTDKMEKSTYDLLASEARIAGFVAIAKGDAPQDSWFHLGRTHVVSRGERALASWTGTMFEYLMPALWMRHYPQTIMQDSMQAIVRLQQKFTRWRSLPWGISESGCTSPDPGQYGYAAFGLPDVALKRLDPRALVISPYSAFLALLIDPRAALLNLRHIEQLGWIGRYGMYEAVDYTDGNPQIIRSWMAHHLGMSLLAVCNLLFDNVLQRDFHAEPQVLATDLLLHERVPARAVAEIEDSLVPLSVAEEGAA